MRKGEVWKILIILEILRSIKNAHNNEIVLCEFSEFLYIIVTASREGIIRIWDFERSYLQGTLQYDEMNEIIALKILNPYPLILCSDNIGQIFLWTTKPYKHENKLLITWKNMFTI